MAVFVPESSINTIDVGSANYTFSACSGELFSTIRVVAQVNNITTGRLKVEHSTDGITFYFLNDVATFGSLYAEVSCPTRAKFYRVKVERDVYVASTIYQVVTQVFKVSNTDINSLGSGIPLVDVAKQGVFSAVSTDNTVSFSLTGTGEVNVSASGAVAKISTADRCFNPYMNPFPSKGSFSGGPFEDVSETANLWWTVQHSNGLMYMLSNTGDRLYYWNPSSRLGGYHETGVPTFGSTMWGLVIHPNGRIYGIPDDSRVIMVFDPTLETFHNISGIPLGSGRYHGGTVFRNYIYCNPFQSNNVLRIDVVNNTFSQIAHALGALTEFYTSVLGADNKIYTSPGRLDLIPIFDPVTETYDTTTLPGPLPGAFVIHKYRGMCTYDCGRNICLANYNADRPLKLTVRPTITMVNWAGAVGTYSPAGVPTGRFIDVKVSTDFNSLVFIPYLEEFFWEGVNATLLGTVQSGFSLGVAGLIKCYTGGVYSVNGNIIGSLFDRPLNEALFNYWKETSSLDIPDFCLSYIQNKI
jgi:hypothetical protein